MAQQGTEAKTGASGEESTGQGATPEESTGKHAASDASTATAQQSAAEQSADRTAPAEAPTEKAAPAEAPTARTTVQGPAQGRPDTSWAEPEGAEPHHRSVDVGELAWRTGNVLATVIRTLALLFALVLVVNVVLVLVGVNPANGVAQFVGAVADIVILGFRDLFLPANPVLMLVVNSLIAAVFWVFVGELASRVIRFLAARVK